MAEVTINMDSMEQLHAVFGDLDSNVNLIQKAFGVTVFSRGSDVKITGEVAAVSRAEKAMQSLSRLSKKGEAINEQSVRYVISMVNDGTEGEVESISSDCVCVSYTGKPIKPKTLGQKKYCDMIRKNTITFGVGPAGTGKTYLAVALAVSAFKAHEIQRIILTRPAVEAGEKLGFLPGDLQNKVDPYLRPLYDALLASLTMGPVSGIAVCLIKNLEGLLTTMTGGVGELSNFILSACLVLPAGLVAKKTSKYSMVIAGCLMGAVLMALVSVFSNYFIVYPVYTVILPMDAIVGMYKAILPSVDGLLECLVIFNMPFTFAKGAIAAVISIPLFKRLKPVFTSLGRD